MEIQLLERCPRCKGRLLLEKDRYGLYEQCMQCGYIHDLQTLGWVDMRKAETSHRVIAKSAVAKPQDTPQWTGPPLFEYLAVPANLQLILNELIKERKNKNYYKKRHRQQPVVRRAV
jgi:hypothetical protein